MRCRKFEARLEDYLEGTSDSELQEHLARCADCDAALEHSRLAGDLLRQAWEPASEPHQAFVAGVMAKIREEQSPKELPGAFWNPITFLASRLSLMAAIVLLALSSYLVEFAPQRTPPTMLNRTELRATDFPEPPADPASNEEVLQSLAERNN